MTRSRRIAFGLGVLLLASGAGGERNLTRAASAWLSTLDAEQRTETQRTFEDEERFDLRLAPLFLEGLRRDRMNDAQWQAWWKVLASTLSAEGLRQVETVMSLEREVLKRDERTWLGGIFGPWIHGEQRYYVSIFGEPATGQAWGLRFDGHHVSLNWTVAADGRISTTPWFIGGEPSEVPDGWERAGLRALGPEEDRARALFEALTPAQRKQAELVFAEASGPAGLDRALFLGEGARIDPGEPAGIARGALPASSQALLDAILARYLDRLAEPLRAERVAAIDAAGRDGLHFAYAGSFERGRPLYYRIHGPTLLIEFDNTVADADHIHTLVREMESDFGRDLLAEHHAHEHGAARVARR